MRDEADVMERVAVGVQPAAYTEQVQDSGDADYRPRLLIGTATTGLVRIEWVQGRYGQLVPPNWSQVSMTTAIPGFYAYRYEVADAQNVIVEEAVKGEYRWLLLWEHDVIPPPDALVRLNEWMRGDHGAYGVVSGLYYTRGYPCEPVMYRGLGTGSVTDYTPGEITWVDGVPTGFLLIAGSILRLMHAESEPYSVQGRSVRRVFETPRVVAHDPESGVFNLLTGTSDLNWCQRVIREKCLERTGFAARTPWPFPVDTRIFCKHIEMNGVQFP